MEDNTAAARLNKNDFFLQQESVLFIAPLNK